MSVRVDAEQRRANAFEVYTFVGMSLADKSIAASCAELFDLFIPFFGESLGGWGSATRPEG
jgi:hypothetical protein